MQPAQPKMKLKARSISRRQAMIGLTLVELMVAVGLAVLLSTGVMQVFIASKRGYYEDEQMANLQENARYALRYIGREISMSGYAGASFDLGDLNAAPFAAIPAINNDCLNATSVADAITFQNDVAANYSSLCATGNLQAGTDLLVVRRIADDYTVEAGTGTVPVGSNDRLYFVRKGAAVGLVKGSSVGTAADTFAAEYYAKSFFVRNYSSVAGDGVPCLVVATLNASGAVSAPECIVEGVEDFQLEFGLDAEALDTDPAVIADRYPNSYTNAPVADDIGGVTSITLYLLVRSTDDITGHRDERSYQLGSKAVAAKNDGFYRRVFSSTVRVPNIMIRTMMATKEAAATTPTTPTTP